MKLNWLIRRSNYSQDCQRWWYNENGLLLSKIIAEQESHLDVLAQVSPLAEDTDAVFETKVRIFRQDFSKAWELLGSIRRISAYGEQSHCIGFKTEADKEMKALCLCKEPFNTSTLSSVSSTETAGGAKYS
jgi:hypothetical protein